MMAWSRAWWRTRTGEHLDATGMGLDPILLESGLITPQHRHSARLRACAPGVATRGRCESNRHPGLRELDHAVGEAERGARAPGRIHWLRERRT